MEKIIPSDPDEHLIQKAVAGDSSAFSALYEKYIHGVYGFIYSKVGSRQEAEDLTQITFTKMLQSLGSFSHQSTFKTWLYSLARNTSMDYWRTYYKNKVVPIEDFAQMLDIPENPSSQDDVDEKEQRVAKILEQLNEDQRAVLTLRFLKGYSIKETAQELLMSESNVKVLQHRGLQKAAEHIEI